VDIVSRSYPHPRELATYSSRPRGRPYIMYDHGSAMGYSSGDLWSYWRQVYSQPYLSGGFVPNWSDQGLRQPQNRKQTPSSPTVAARGRRSSEPPLLLSRIEESRDLQKAKKNEKTFWAYGGDFGPAD